MEGAVRIPEAGAAHRKPTPLPGRTSRLEGDRVAAADAAFLPFASSGFGFHQATTPNRFVFDRGRLRGQPIVSDRGAT